MTDGVDADVAELDLMQMADVDTVIERELSAWMMRAQGLGFREIGKRLGVSHTTAHNYCTRAKAKLVDHFAVKAEHIVLEQLAGLQHIYRQALKGWRNSLEDEVVHEEGVTGQGVVDKRKTKGQAGDPRFLSEGRAALADIRRLVPGVEQPHKVEIDWAEVDRRAQDDLHKVINLLPDDDTKKYVLEQIVSGETSAESEPQTGS